MATDTATLKSELAQTSGQFSTFFVADLFFGVDVLRVQEVLRFQQMTRVPQAPEVIEGLINLRGQIVTAIDMRRRLRLPPRAGDQTPMNMVVRSEDPRASGPGGHRGADQLARPNRHRHRYAAAAPVAAARRRPDADEHGSPHRGWRRKFAGR